ncbi:MAG TPA: transcription termination/antitermination NusG family protein [Anaerolineaceae bacterium]|nr:transcription termination/antitermination NusG family protein [Anaerolineaceae bacterium]
MSLHWYAIASHPNKEDILWRHLLSKEVEVFYPRVPVQPVNPRARKIRAYFPGYMFVRTDVEAVGISFFQYMPHAKGLVSFGGEPSVVPEALIETLRQKIEAVIRAGGEHLDGLKPGDSITIEQGPFAGYEAIFNLRIPGSQRVRVLLKMLSDQQIPLELSAGQIKKKNPPKPPA